MFGFIKDIILFEAKQRHDQEIMKLGYSVSDLEQLCLALKLRELANIIIAEDLDRFINCYKLALAWAEKFSSTLPKGRDHSRSPVTLKHEIEDAIRKELGMDSARKIEYHLLGWSPLWVYKANTSVYKFDDVCEEFLNTFKEYFIWGKLTHAKQPGWILGHGEFLMKQEINWVRNKDKEIKNKNLITLAKEAISLYREYKSDYIGHNYEVTLLKYPQRKRTRNPELGIRVKKSNDFIVVVFSNGFLPNLTTVSYYRTNSEFSNDSEEHFETLFYHGET